MRGNDTLSNSANIWEDLIEYMSGQVLLYSLHKISEKKEKKETLVSPQD